MAGKSVNTTLIPIDEFKFTNVLASCHVGPVFIKVVAALELLCAAVAIPIVSPAA